MISWCIFNQTNMSSFHLPCIFFAYVLCEVFAILNIVFVFYTSNAAVDQEFLCPNPWLERQLMRPNQWHIWCIVRFVPLFSSLIMCLEVKSITCLHSKCWIITNFQRLSEDSLEELILIIEQMDNISRWSIRNARRGGKRTLLYKISLSSKSTRMWPSPYAQHIPSPLMYDARAYFSCHL